LGDNEKMKYVLLVEKLTECMAGCDVRIIAKFGNTKKELTAWAKEKYPNSRRIILNNNPKLADFFELSSVYSMDLSR